MEGREEAIKDIRSVLTSIKGSCSLHKLRTDHRMLMGGDIDFRRYGFPSLEDFLQSEPSFLIRRTSEGLVIDARISDKTAHISEMIARQKTVVPKRKLPKRRAVFNTHRPQSNRYNSAGFSSYGGAPSRLSSRPASPPISWKPKHTSNRWLNSYQRSPRPNNYSHNQFVSVSAMNGNNNNNNNNQQQQQQQRSGQQYQQQLQQYQQQQQQQQFQPQQQQSQRLLQQQQQQQQSNNLHQSKQQSSQHRGAIPKTTVGKNNNIYPVESVKSKVVVKQQLSFDSDSSSSSSMERFPHSNKTNRSVLLQHKKTATIPAPVTSTPTLSRSPPAAVGEENSAALANNVVRPPPTTTSRVSAFERLKRESVAAAADLSSDVWRFSSSDNDTTVTSDSSSSVRRKEGPFVPTGNAIDDLKTFMKLKQLGEPIEKISKQQLQHNKPTYYYCKITISEGKTFTSYPLELTTEHEARLHTASLALTSLQQTTIQPQLVSDARDVLSRVPPLVQLHANGIWSAQLEDIYADRYGEQLPLDWLRLVDVSPSISVERNVSERSLLRYCRPEDLLQKGNPAASIAGNAVQMAATGWHSSTGGVSIAANTARFDSARQLHAQITCVESPKEVWCRQINTPEADAFDLMSDKLDRVFNEPLHRCTKPAQIVVGAYYVIKYEDSWCRVRALELKENTVLCFYVDYGDDQEVPVEHVYTLEREFAVSHAQAFTCRLAGLEVLYEFCANSEILQTLVGRNVMLHLEETDVETKPNDPFPVVVYDVEKKVFINQELIKLLTMESATPNLNSSGVTEVFLSNIEDNGDIYVQIHSPGYDTLMNLTEDFENELLTNKGIVPEKALTKANSANKIYFARYEKDGRFYRVQINDWEPNGRFVQLFFIDFGNTQIIKTGQDMYELEKYSDVLSQFPGQAVKIRLDIPEVPSDFSTKLKELIDESVLLVKIERHEHSVPIVKMFKRFEPDNVLVSINETLEIKYEKKTDKLNKLMLNSDKNVPSCGVLKSPEISEVGKFFDIFVPIAYSPWNFFIQPWNSKTKLSKLMEILQARYKDVQYSPLQVEDIIPGKIYASRHPENNKWHRTSVIKVINSSSISVFYCDFGFYSNLHCNQLMPLDMEFLELPYQAIKGKLDGIKPKNDKWTMDDCQYFKKLVTEKCFVSIPQKFETDEFCPSDTILSLKLVDTSGKEDVFIDDLLIKKNMAVRV